MPYSDFLSSAMFPLGASLGLEGCSPTIALNQVAVDKSTTTGTVNKSTAAASPTTVAFRPSLSTLSDKAKVAIGIAVPIVVVVIIALMTFVCHRNRIFRRKGPAKEQQAFSNEIRPYFQQKGELDAEGTRRYELHAEDQRHQLPEEIEILEMSTQGEQSKTTERWTLELRGDEHCQELD